jgi:hypothetical protein
MIVQVTFHEFLLALGVGSAVMAFWFVARFPEKTPQNFARAVLHVCVALLLGAVVPYVIAVIDGYGYPAALASMFAVLMPVLVYTFLSGAWVLKLTADTFARYRR